MANGNRITQTFELTTIVELEWNDFYSNPAKVAAAKAIMALWDTIEKHPQIKVSEVNQMQNSCFYSYRAQTGRMFYAKVS
jgi:hypothetical protein